MRDFEEMKVGIMAGIQQSAKRHWDEVLKLYHQAWFQDTYQMHGNGD